MSGHKKLPYAKERAVIKMNIYPQIRATNTLTIKIAKNYPITATKT